MDTPEFARELMQVYVSETGMSVRLTPMREQALTEAHLAGILPEDLRNVIRELKRLQKRRPEIYGDACFEFSRLFQIDKLEERMWTLRSRAASKRKSVQVPVKRGEFMVLDDPEQKEPQEIRTAMAGQLSDLASQLRNTA